MNKASKESLVLIDGENLFHQILHVLREQKLIEHRKELTHLDLRGLVEDILSDQPGIEIRYFTTKAKLVKQITSLTLKSQGIIDHQRLWKRNLMRQNIDYIAAGNLKVRDGLACRKCGHKESVLQEKGVDVRIAVDLLIAAAGNKYEKIYLASSDTDLLPAIAAARRFGQRVIYIAQSTAVNIAITAHTRSLLTFSEYQIIAAFKGKLKGKKHGK